MGLAKHRTAIEMVVKPRRRCTVRVCNTIHIPGPKMYRMVLFRTNRVHEDEHTKNSSWAGLGALETDLAATVNG